MSYYLPHARLVRFLEARGFSPEEQYGETVYVRGHDAEPRLFLEVWTGHMRGPGLRAWDDQDLRVYVVWQGAFVFRVHREKAVVRVGEPEAILDRLYERLVSAYRHGTVWLRTHRDEITAGICQ